MLMKTLMAPVAFIFYLIQALRGILYDMGFLKQEELDRPVICVGNLTTGGTGKTPWVQKLSGLLTQQGANLCILSRGYSGSFKGVLQVTDDMDPRLCGDEPLWLKHNTQAQVYVGRSRKEAAKKAEAEHSPSCFILDDGFQHRSLARDLDIVLIDVSAPLSHYQMLPLGRLREPFSALKRASLVILNKCNYVSKEELDQFQAWVHKQSPSVELFCADFVFSQWEPLIPELAISEIEGAVAMTCGLGNPRSFLKTLQQLGIQTEKQYIFPDHYYWKPEDIERMTQEMKDESIRHLVITEKDAVKLNRYKKHFFEMGRQVWICKMQVQLREGLERLEEKLVQVQRGL